MGLGITFQELWDCELHLRSCGIGNCISGAVGGFKTEYKKELRPP